MTMTTPPPPPPPYSLAERQQTQFLLSLVWLAQGSDQQSITHNQDEHTWCSFGTEDWNVKCIRLLNNLLVSELLPQVIFVSEEKMCYLFDEMMSVFILNQHAEFDFSRNLELYFYFYSYIEGLYFVRQWMIWYFLKIVYCIQVYHYLLAVYFGHLFSWSTGSRSGNCRGQSLSAIPFPLPFILHYTCICICNYEKIH